MPLKKTWLAPSLKAQAKALVALMRTEKFSALAYLNFPIRQKREFPAMSLLETPFLAFTYLSNFSATISACPLSR
jgi:hypothetical protein